jgi:hypothetical protein
MLTRFEFGCNLMKLWPEPSTIPPPPVNRHHGLLYQYWAYKVELLAKTKQFLCLFAAE